MKSTLCCFTLFASCLSAALDAQVVPYDIVYVRQPRFGDNTNTTWPEVLHPARIDRADELRQRAASHDFARRASGSAWALANECVAEIALPAEVFELGFFIIERSP